jgi:hypothetical protein
MRFAVGFLLVIGLAIGGIWISGGWDRGRAFTNSEPVSSSTPFLDASNGLPNPAEPAFRVGQPRLLARGANWSRFAPVSRQVTARTAPRPDARAVAALATQTEERTTNIVVVLREKTIRGLEWVHIRLPVLPNGRTGWVPRNALGGYTFVDTRLVVDRRRFTATLYSGDRPIFEAPVGVGTRAAPTPAGKFYVRLKLSGFNNPFYGPVAFGTNARSTTLTDWPGGGYIGIHGTNAPSLIPGRISHGCVRMRNLDIIRLSPMMPVGTPVTIR